MRSLHSPVHTRILCGDGDLRDPAIEQGRAQWIRTGKRSKHLRFLDLPNDLPKREEKFWKYYGHSINKVQQTVIITVGRSSPVLQAAIDYMERPTSYRPPTRDNGDIDGHVISPTILLERIRKSLRTGSLQGFTIFIASRGSLSSFSPSFSSS